MKFYLFFSGYILIFVSIVKSSKREDNQLRCYKCGEGGFPSCKYFNASDVFVTICPHYQKSCLKGWVNGEHRDEGQSEKRGKEMISMNAVFRHCAPIAENICFKQNSGYIQN